MEKNTKIHIAVSLALFLFLAVPGAWADVLDEQHVFNTDPYYDSKGRSQINATLLGFSDRAYFYVEDSYWNTLDLYSQAQLRTTMIALGDEFDDRIYPI